MGKESKAQFEFIIETRSKYLKAAGDDPFMDYDHQQRYHNFRYFNSWNYRKHVDNEPSDPIFQSTSIILHDNCTPTFTPLFYFCRIHTSHCSFTDLFTCYVVLSKYDGGICDKYKIAFSHALFVGHYMSTNLHHQFIRLINLSRLNN